jgi:hypothetical protein
MDPLLKFDFEDDDVVDETEGSTASIEGKDG